MVYNNITNVITGSDFMKDSIQISDAEFEVMKVIWENYPINTNDIASILLQTTDWSVRTIQTMIGRLEKKKAITHEKEGRIFVYSPLIKKEDYVKSVTSSFLNKFYNGAINKMLLNFINNDMLSEQDIEELRNILKKE